MSAISTALDGHAVGQPIAREVVEGDAGVELVCASRGARFLVVGTRGRGTLRSALFGSVSEYCVHHANCPVVVVRADTHPMSSAEVVTSEASVPAQVIGISRSAAGDVGPR